MRWDDRDLFIAGTGVALGDPEPVTAAVADGRYRERDAARTEQLAVTIADADQASVDLAAAAGRAALKQAGCDPASVAMLLHAAAARPGALDAWNPAAYIARELGLTNAHIACEIASACAGALVGLELAVPFLLSRPQSTTALVTAGDVWPGPWIDRWQADSELPLADGAGAVVLSRERGFARIAAMSTLTDTSLEALGRGQEPLQPLPADQRRIDLYTRAHDFLRASGITKQEVWRRKEVLVRGLVAKATAEAGLSRPSDFAHIILPFAGRHVFEREWLPWLGVDLDRTSFGFGRSIGHLGPADPLATLHHLADAGRLQPGDRALMLMDGLGLVCTTVVLEVL